MRLHPPALWPAIFILCVCWAGGVAAGELRIAYLDMGRVLEDAPQAAVASRVLEAEFVPIEHRLEQQAAALAQLEAHLQEARTARDETRAGLLAAELDAGRTQLARAREAYSDALRRRLDAELAGLQEAIRAVVDRLAEERQYDLVLFDGVLRASPRVEITDEVLARLGAGQQ